MLKRISSNFSSLNQVYNHQNSIYFQISWNFYWLIQNYKLRTKNKKLKPVSLKKPIFKRYNTFKLLNIALIWYHWGYDSEFDLAKSLWIYNLIQPKNNLKVSSASTPVINSIVPNRGIPGSYLNISGQFNVKFRNFLTN